MNDNRDVHDEPQSKVRKLDSSCSNAQCTDGVGQAEAVPIPEEIMISPVGEVPFNNGQWLPVCPEPAEKIYWWGFPWYYKFGSKYDWQIHSSTPTAVWKLVAGRTITHLPDHCMYLMTPRLYCDRMDIPRVAPQVINFGSMYEDVLEFFTERMLGINDFIPLEKRGLLNKLFDITGYQRDLEIIGKQGLVPDMYPI